MNANQTIPDYILSNRCQTRDGREVFIHTTKSHKMGYPIAGEVLTDGCWNHQCWTATGRFRISGASEDGLDLIPLPEPAREPREWILTSDSRRGSCVWQGPALREGDYIPVREILPAKKYASVRDLVADCGSPEALVEFDRMVAGSATGAGVSHALKGGLEAASNPASPAPAALGEGKFNIDVPAMKAELEKQGREDREIIRVWEKAGRQISKMDALDILHKWHNWIASGQLNFTPEHLAESKLLLNANGYAVVEIKPDTPAPAAFRVGDRVVTHRFDTYGSYCFVPKRMETFVGRKGEVTRVSEFYGILVHDFWWPASACTLAEPEVKLPEGVPPPPDGFEYWGKGPLPVNSGVDSLDIALIDDNRWRKGAHGGSTIARYALRIGSEIHRLNTVAGKGVQP